MRFITAHKIFDGLEFLISNSVIVLNDDSVIIDIINEQETDALNIEHFNGILSPGFINTHCHLELSHLHNKIKPKTGIVNFAFDIIKNRNFCDIELQKEKMHEADTFMYEQGIVAVGDISNTTISIDAKLKSNIQYHTFVELIGLNPQFANDIYTKGLDVLNEFKNVQLSASLAPHAPYSTSLELINLITKNCNTQKLPTSIHNQESIAENLFFEKKSGDFLNLFKQLNINIDWFKPTHKTSLQTYLASFHKHVNSLLVHNTFTSLADIEFAVNQHQKLFWCLCPNANLYIENTLPDVNLLLSTHCNLTLGTDSLASNKNLSIINEINTLKNKCINIGLEQLLKMATHNGAQFLGIEKEFGSVAKGKKPGINLIIENGQLLSVKKII